MKKTFACAILPNKAPSMRRGLSIIQITAMGSTGAASLTGHSWHQSAFLNFFLFFCDFCDVFDQLCRFWPLLVVLGGILDCFRELFQALSKRKWEVKDSSSITEGRLQLKICGSNMSFFQKPLTPPPHFWNFRGTFFSGSYFKFFNTS